jgi:hypothetical protein
LSGAIPEVQPRIRGMPPGFLATAALQTVVCEVRFIPDPLTRNIVDALPGAAGAQPVDAKAMRATPTTAGAWQLER